MPGTKPVANNWVTFSEFNSGVPNAKCIAFCDTTHKIGTISAPSIKPTRNGWAMAFSVKVVGIKTHLVRAKRDGNGRFGKLGVRLIVTVHVGRH